MSVSGKFIRFALIALALGVGIPSLVSGAVMIDDDFAGTSDYWVWDKGTTGSANVGYSRDAEFVELQGGTQAGSTAWLQTLPMYDTGQGSRLFLDLALSPGGGPMSAGDDVFFGFHRVVAANTFSVGFHMVWGANGKELIARSRSGALIAETTIGSPNWDDVVDYRIEVQNGTADFFIDDQLVWSVTGWEVPQGLLYVRLDKTSPGRSRTLSIDRVRLTESFVRNPIAFDIKPAEGASREAGGPAFAPGAIAEASWGDLKGAYR